MKTRRALALFLFAALGSLAARAQLVAYFPFAGSAADATGHGFDATTVNATYTPNGYTGTGASGGAYLFDGASNYIEIGNLNINPAVYPQLTMGAWVLAADSNPIRQIISHDDSGFDRSLGIDWRGGVSGWSAFAGSGVLGGETVTTAAWTFVAVAYDQTAGTATLYVDGRSYGTTNAATGNGWNFTRLGMNPSFGEYFAGTIDEVFFYAGALDSTAIASLRANGLAAVPEPSTGILTALGLATLIAPSLRRRLTRERRG